MTKKGDNVADVIATVGVNYSSCQCLSRRAQPAAAPRGRRGSGVLKREGTAKLGIDAAIGRRRPQGKRKREASARGGGMRR